MIDTAGPDLLVVGGTVVTAEGGGERVLVEAIRLLVRGDPGMGVDIDAARQDEEPGRVDYVRGSAGEARQVGIDPLDPTSSNGDVRPT